MTWIAVLLIGSFHAHLVGAVTVGYPADDRGQSDNGNGMQFVSEYTIPVRGDLVLWEIYTFRAAAVQLQVWRPDKSGCSSAAWCFNYHLVSSTYHNTGPGYSQKPVRISVLQGDVLGWYSDGPQPIQYDTPYGSQVVRRAYGYNDGTKYVSMNDHVAGWQRSYSIQATIIPFLEWRRVEGSKHCLPWSGFTTDSMSTTAQECKDECALRTSCVAITFFPVWGDHCYLFEACSEDNLGDAGPVPNAYPAEVYIKGSPVPADVVKEEKAVWGPESWEALLFCQAMLVFWVFVDLVVKRRVWNFANRRFGLRCQVKLRSFWQLGSFLFVIGVMWLSWYINGDFEYWYLPNLITLIMLAVAYQVMKRCFPETSRKIFALQVVDEETNDGQPPPIESLPEYWTNKKLRHPKNFDQMVYVEEDRLPLFDHLLNTCYRPIATQDRECPKKTDKCKRTPGGCPCVKPGGTPGLPTCYVARRVIRVEDSDMWVKYADKREEVRNKRQTEDVRKFDPPLFTDEVVTQNPQVFEPLDKDMNECYLWHGTSVRIALAIAQNDFRIDLAGSNAGTMYGKGAYLAESSTKCDEYAHDEPDGYYDGIRALVLCRVIMGKLYYTTGRDEKAGERFASGEFDSTLGDRVKSVNTFREFVCYSNDHVYPEYVVLYSRAHGDEEEQRLRKQAQVKFLMELPLYWTNCHNNPATDPFDTEYRVRESSKDLITELAARTRSGGGVDVLDVVRIEDSKMWLRYIEFKRSMHQANLRAEDLEAADDGRQVGCTPIQALGDTSNAVALTQSILETLNAEDTISLDNFDVHVNELLLWHGSTQEAVEAIGRDGFRIPREEDAKHGKRFGEGAYFAEDLDKSMDYAPDAFDGSKFFLLCRVALGEIYLTKNNVEKEAHKLAVDAGKNSVLAVPPSGSREFIVLKESQVYPEFVVKLRPL